LKLINNLSTRKLVSLAVLSSLTLITPAAKADWVGELTSYKALSSLATGRDVTVAVLDSGVNRGLFGSGAKILPGLDLVDSGTVISDTNSHGSEVIATLLSVAPQTTILPIRVMAESGADMDKVASGIIYATDQGAKIINLSFGAPGACTESGQSAINYANQHGVIVVAAVGNSNSNLLTCPAGFEGVLGVGASNQYYLKSGASNYGSYLDILAPGENLSIPYLNGTFILNGTSFATPLVSATLAAIIELHPLLSRDALLGLLTSSVADIYSEGKDELSGYGILDPYQALLKVGGEEPLSYRPTLSASPITAAGESSTLTLNVGGVAKVKFFSKLTGSTFSNWEVIYSGEVSNQKNLTTTPLNNTSYYLCLVDNRNVINTCTPVMDLVVPNALDNSLSLSISANNGVVNQNNQILVSATAGNPRGVKSGILVNLTINSSSTGSQEYTATTNNEGIATFTLNNSLKGELSAFARASFDGKSATSNQSFLNYELDALPNYSLNENTLSFTFPSISLGGLPLPISFQSFNDSWSNLDLTLTGETLTATLPVGTSKIRYQVTYLEGDYRILPSSDYTILTLIETPNPPTPTESATVVETPTPIVETPAPVVHSPAPVVNSPAPVVNSPAPLVNSPAPLVNSPEPVVNSPAPVVNSPATVGGAPAQVVSAVFALTVGDSSSENPTTLTIDTTTSQLNLNPSIITGVESNTAGTTKVLASNKIETSIYDFTIQSVKVDPRTLQSSPSQSTLIKATLLTKAYLLTKAVINKLTKSGVRKITISGNKTYLNGVKKILKPYNGLNITYKVGPVAIVTVN
jgi:hypothetical protein